MPTIRALAAAVTLLLAATPAVFAQAPGEGILRITVVDPSGAVIVGAVVTVTLGGSSRSVPTDGRGDAVFTGLAPGRYTARIESPGFEPAQIADVRVRAGENRRQARLAIAKIAEHVTVDRDRQVRASDPRSDGFATVLGQAEIQELPDDPDEFEQALKDMAGPGAVIRVNGFRGGKLPPKDQIQQIRFRRNMFAADLHEQGFVSIDIITKPGFDAWRGTAAMGFRDSALSARNAFAPVKPAEQTDRPAFSLSGPLDPHKTSLSLAADGLDAYDAKTIVAALPSGPLAESIHQPNLRFNVTARLEQAIGSQVLRAEVQQNHTSTDNLDVGDFDLPERGYDQSDQERIARVAVSGAPRKSLFNEFRFQWRSDTTTVDPASTAPAVLVPNAFDTGGAQLSGATGARELEIADDLDIAAGRHSLRTGFLLEGGWYTTDQRRNAGGTFTFASLAGYLAGQPLTFTRNVGDPHVEAGNVQSGVYLQDDIRASRNLTITVGARQEVQTHVGGLHVGPRGGVVWSPSRSGRTTVRAGGGVFYDWFDAQSYEQAVQLDGTHEITQTVVDPGYPDPNAAGTAVVLPAGRVQIAPGLGQPETREALVGLEQQLGAGVRLNAMYIHRRGVDQLRGVNVNAPLADGLRPDPSVGPITEIESVAASWYDGLVLNLNYGNPQRHIFVAANYTLSRTLNEADSPFALPANSYDLAAERGPAPTDARHRFMSFAMVPLGRRLRLGTSVHVQSGLPYNITTGFDDNGDTIINDRPAGVGRNSGRGTATVDVNARLGWTLGFGGPAAPPAGPQVRILRPGDDPLASGPGPGDARRYSVEFYVQGYNLLNHVDPITFSGVMTSPFFGQATSAGPPRRVEVGARMTF